MNSPQSEAKGLANCNLLALQEARFSRSARHVTRIHRSSSSDFFVVGWEPGQESSTHSHSGFESAIIVLSGAVVVRDGSGQAAVLGVGALSVTPPGCTHKISNRSGERAVTLHIYSPPLDEPMPQPFTDLVAGMAR